MVNMRSARALCLCFYGRAFNEILRWYWRVEQTIDTHERYAGLLLEERIRNNDIGLRCAHFAEDCAADLLPYFDIRTHSVPNYKQ